MYIFPMFGTLSSCPALVIYRWIYIFSLFFTPFFFFSFFYAILVFSLPTFWLYTLSLGPRQLSRSKLLHCCFGGHSHKETRPSILLNFCLLFSFLPFRTNEALEIVVDTRYKFPLVSFWLLCVISNGKKWSPKIPGRFFKIIKIQSKTPWLKFKKLSIFQ